jgi:hypothetical protein
MSGWGIWPNGVRGVRAYRRGWGETDPAKAGSVSLESWRARVSVKVSAKASAVKTMARKVRFMKA